MSVSRTVFISETRSSAKTCHRRRRLDLPSESRSATTWFRAGRPHRRNCKILDGAVLGKQRQKRLFQLPRETPVSSPLVLGRAVTSAPTVSSTGEPSWENGVFVGDLASIREDVTNRRAHIIGRGVTIENKTNIGRKCKIETEAYITAMSTVEDYCFIAPCVASPTTTSRPHRAAEKTLRRPHPQKGARIGANATPFGSDRWRGRPRRRRQACHERSPPGRSSWAPREGSPARP